MAENAWPFLIGRAKQAGYRVVVVPDFLAGAASADALSGAARDVRLPSDTACVRELRGLECGPVTVVYRCFTPRAEDYGLGEGDLNDSFGRPIRVTEGVVLRSAVKAGLPEITVADLDRTHAAVAEAYRDFWEHDRDFVRRTSTADRLGTGERSSEQQPIRLEIAEPWSRTRVDTGVREVAVPEPRERRSRRPLAAVLAAAVVLVAGLVVGTQVLGGKSTPTPATVLGDLCHALKAGHPDEAYGYTSPQLRRAVSLPDFEKQLLSTADRATTCTYSLGPTSGSTAQGTLTLVNGTAPSTVWTVTLVNGNGTTWQINRIAATAAQQGGAARGLSRRHAIAEL